MLSELVCSNSLGSNLPDRASGLLKEELRQLGSLLINCADATALPAGGALAVDREAFARLVTEKIESNPRIRVVRHEQICVPREACVVASGPLTSEALSTNIRKILGSEHLYFFDALAPIVYANTIDMNIAFRASRYQRGDTELGDYINCPLDEVQYDAFVQNLLKAQRIPLRAFEQDIVSGVRAGAHRYFEGCLPVEILAARGHDTLAYGPMRPVGLCDPRSGRRPHAVVQLRQDNLAGTLYNLVGFQTNLKQQEQRRVLRMLPGLEHANFARYGMMHRNTFINSPAKLLPTMQARVRADLFFAGQITGVEGYVGNVATGLLAGINAARLLSDKPVLTLPRNTMSGALCHYVTHAEHETFQPMKANFGLLPTLDPPEGKTKWPKRERYSRYSIRALQALAEVIDVAAGSHGSI
jgi:methylenetetrahydrofolate--tRNA-(uracil-5-)-methyltransferase